MSRAILLTICSAVAACGQPEITVIGEDSSNLAALRTVSQTHDGGMVIDFQPETFGDLLEKSNQDLALGSGQYDVIMQYNFTLSSYVENNLVWSIGELRDQYPEVDCPDPDNFFQAAWREVGFYYSDTGDETSEPAAFGYPFATNTLLLAANAGAFRATANRELYRELTGKSLEPPSTWDDFHELAEFFSENTEIEGVVLQGATEGWLYYEWASVLASQGVSVFPEKEYGWERASSTEISLSRPEVIEATERYLALRPFNAGGFEDVDASAQIDLLRRGRAAMGVVWSDFAPTLLEDGDTTYTLHPLPGEYSPLAGGAFYINRNSRFPRQAYEFVCWVLGEEQQRALLRENLGSPLQTAYADQILRESEFARAMVPSIERGRYAFEANRDSELIQTAVTTALQRAWREPERLEEFFAEADREINQARRGLFSSAR